MDYTDADQPGEIDFRKLVPQEHRHQAEPPGVFRDAFWPSQ
jgi:hypothetical protein